VQTVLRVSGDLRAESEYSAQLRQASADLVRHAKATIASAKETIARSRARVARLDARLALKRTAGLEVGDRVEGEQPTPTPEAYTAARAADR
jgi:hypothetical protein